LNRIEDCVKEKKLLKLGKIFIRAIFSSSKKQLVESFQIENGFCDAV
jgi:hypothetical protein